MKIDAELPASSVMVRAMSTVPAQVHGTVLGVDAGCIRLSVPYFLPPATRVSIKFSANCQEGGEITSCERQDDHYCLRAHFRPGRQWGARFPVECGEIVGVELFGTDSVGGFHAVTLGRVANGNLIINCSRPIAPNRVIRLDVRSGIMFGMVKCCTFIGPWHRITVDVEKTVFRSDSLRFLRFVLADLRKERSQFQLWLHRGAFWHRIKRENGEKINEGPNEGIFGAG
jgi:hypothetical protein